MNTELHKKVIEEQKALADKAGKKISARLIHIIPIRQMVAVMAVNKASRPILASKVAKILTTEYIRLIDAPTNETLKIGAAFAQEKINGIPT